MRIHRPAVFRQTISPGKGPPSFFGLAVRSAPSPPGGGDKNVAAVPEGVELESDTGAPIGHHRLHHGVHGKLAALMVNLKDNTSG